MGMEKSIFFLIITLLIVIGAIIFLKVTDKPEPPITTDPSVVSSDDPDITRDPSHTEKNTTAGTDETSGSESSSDSTSGPEDSTSAEITTPEATTEEPENTTPEETTTSQEEDRDGPAHSNTEIGKVDSKTGKVSISKTGKVGTVENIDYMPVDPTLNGTFTSQIVDQDGNVAPISLIVKWKAAPSETPNAWYVDIRVDLQSYSAFVGPRDNGEIYLDGYVFHFDSPQISISKDDKTLTTFCDKSYRVVFTSASEHTLDLAANWLFGGSYGKFSIQWLGTGGTITLG